MSRKQSGSGRPVLILGRWNVNLTRSCFLEMHLIVSRFPVGGLTADSFKIKQASNVY